MQPNNLVCLTGRVAVDPHYRPTDKGGNAWLKLAVKGKTDTFIPVTIWDKEAEFVRDHVSKGDLVQIGGRLTTYKPKDSEKDVLQFTGDSVQLLCKKGVATVKDDNDPFEDE